MTLQTAPSRNSSAETTVSVLASVMDVAAAEWLKLRTMRAAWVVWAGAAVSTLIGLIIIMGHVGSYDQATPGQQASFESADPAVAVMPLVAFFIGTLSALVMTTEFSTGSIAPSLVAVPQRRTLLAAKSVVVTCVALAGGVLFASLSQIGAMLILGDRPAPLNPWTHWWEAVPPAAGTAVTTLATGLVALGLGAVLRSAAATVAVIGALTLVVPMFAHVLPEPVHLWVASVLIPNLAPQIAGAESAYLLAPPVAAAVLAFYVVVTLGAASLSFSRRDS